MCVCGSFLALPTIVFVVFRECLWMCRVNLYIHKCVCVSFCHCCRWIRLSGALVTNFPCIKIERTDREYGVVVAPRISTCIKSEFEGNNRIAVSHNIYILLPSIYKHTSSCEWYIIAIIRYIYSIKSHFVNNFVGENIYIDGRARLVFVCLCVIYSIVYTQKTRMCSNEVKECNKCHAKNKNRQTIFHSIWMNFGQTCFFPVLCAVVRENTKFIAFSISVCAWWAFTNLFEPNLAKWIIDIIKRRKFQRSI